MHLFAQQLKIHVNFTKIRETKPAQSYQSLLHDYVIVYLCVCMCVYVYVVCVCAEQLCLHIMHVVLVVILCMVWCVYECEVETWKTVCHMADNGDPYAKNNVSVWRSMASGPQESKEGL